MPDPTIQEKIKGCIDRLYEADEYLIVRKAQERSVTHKLAEYLQKEFDDWNVDCEYDLFGEHQKKRLDRLAETCNDPELTGFVLPDIIIHHRGVQDGNLLVVEAKKTGRDCSCDIEKLKLFTEEAGQFKYRLGLLLVLKETPELLWYENGAVLPTNA